MKEARPRDEIDKLYKTNEWRKLRELVITRDFGVCQECKRRGVVKKGVVVHHIIEAREDITKFWDINNLELVVESSNQIAASISEKLFNNYQRVPEQLLTVTQESQIDEHERKKIIEQAQKDKEYITNVLGGL